jgi:hypothetical protein
MHLLFPKLINLHSAGRSHNSVPWMTTTGYRIEKTLGNNHDIILTVSPEFTWPCWPLSDGRKDKTPKIPPVQHSGKFRQGTFEGVQPMLPVCQDPTAVYPEHSPSLPSNRRCQSEPGQRGLRNSHKAAHATPTPIVLANVALSPTRAYYRDTRSLLHVDDPQHSYSCGDMAHGVVWGDGGGSSRSMGMVPTFSRSREIPKTIYLPPQRPVISSCLVSTFSCLSYPVLHSRGLSSVIITILEGSLSLRTNYNSHAGHQRCKRCCLQREGSD